MTTASGVKRAYISHLEWCLEKLKCREHKCDEELFNYIYRYICETIIEMERQEAMVAIKYFRERMNKKIRQILLRFNLELSV